MKMPKLALCCAMVLFLTGCPVLADRKLRHLPFHHLGKLHDKHAEEPQPRVVAAQPQIIAPQPQYIIQQQHVMVPYIAATPQIPVVAAAPNFNPPPPSVQYVPVPTPVPTPVKEYIVKEKVVVKKVPVFVPVPVKHHHILPLKIVGAVAKTILHEMDHKQVNVTVTDEYVPDAPAPAPDATIVASAPAPAPMATANPVPTFNATLAGMSG